MRKLLLFILFSSIGSLCVASPAVTFFQEQGTTAQSGSTPAGTSAPGAVAVPTSLVGVPQVGSAPVRTDSTASQIPVVKNGGPEAEKEAPSQTESSDSGTGTVRVKKTSSGIKLNFSDAPIDRVVRSIMQELGYSYVIDPQVQGTVNIFTVREIPKERLFEVLEQLLKMNGQAIVKQDDFFVILPIGKSPTVPHGVLMEPLQKREEVSETEQGEVESELPAESITEGEAEGPSSTEQMESTQEGPKIVKVEKDPKGFGLADEKGVITYIIPLHYIPSDQMLQMAQAFISSGATVVDFAPANMLLLTDYTKNVQQVLNLVEMLDTRYFNLNAVDLIPIRYNQAVDVAEDLGKIFAPGEEAAGVRIVAIERLNSILVVTKSPDVFQEVSKWIVKLDTPSSTSNMKTYVYQVENNTAVQIAQILAELYQDGSGLPSSVTGEGTEGGQQQGRLGQDARGASQRSAFRQDGFVDDTRMDTRGVGGNLAMRELGPALSKDSRSQIRAIAAGNVRIVVNEFNNSLIIQGTEADIQFILETVEQLDTLPRQVVIEARIYAVELRDELSFGVSAFLQARGTQTGPATIGSISAPSEGTSGGILSLTTRAIIGQDREVVAILNALRSKTNVEILDAPTVMALDGTPASINVGAEVPVTTASYGNPLQSGTTNFINTIQFRPTGTTLLIVPRISASGIVTMDVVIEVSNATGPSLTPTINRTYSQSSFIVRDGQTIGIAGLMSDSYSLGKSRVPVIGDIPIIGALFGTTERSVSRRELVIFITPQVIRSLPTAAELTLEFRRALRHAYDFISAQEEIDRMTIEKNRQKELELENPSIQ